MNIIKMIKKLAIFTFFIVVAHSEDVKSNNGQKNSKPEKGALAPEIELSEIYHKKSDDIPTIASLEGEVIVLYFWATWCSPCLTAFPKIDELNKKYENEDVRIISVTDDPPERLESFLENSEVGFWIGRDQNEKTFQTYQVDGRPDVFIINREGTIVYQGGKITGNLLDEVLATNTIEVSKEMPSRVITFGGFAGGEDPLYNAAQVMKGKDRQQFHKPIAQHIVRYSLEDSYRGHGRKKTESGYIGFTFSGGDIISIMRTLHDKTSDLYINDHSKDTSLYDIVYWDKANSYENAYAEILAMLNESLSIRVDTIKKTQKVHVLSVNEATENVRTYEDIDEGTFGLYTSIDRYISLLEQKSGEFYSTDESAENKFIKVKKSAEMNQKSIEELTGILEGFGISVNVQQQETELLDIHPID